MNVLIIDDEIELNQALCENLHHVGMKTFSAHNGEQGLSLLQTEKIDLVVCDVSMPKMNGIDFLKQARAQFPKLPIYMMTGYSKVTELELYQLGATGYFTKPDAIVEQLLKIGKSGQLSLQI